MTTYTRVAGLWLPTKKLYSFNGGPGFGSTRIDAAGEKHAYSGPYWNKDGTSKAIRKIHFYPGAVTSAGGSTMTASLQDVDATTGVPIRPDEVQDQTVGFNLNTVTANTWFTTGALSADRTVAYGEWLSVVLEFNSFAGADLLDIKGVSPSPDISNVCVASKQSGSWVAQSIAPNLLLEDSAGGFGTIGDSWPMSAVTTTALNTGTTPDEIALEFTVPFNCLCDGAWVVVASTAAGRDFDIVLYDGTTQIASYSIDGDRTVTTTGKVHYAFWTGVDLVTTSTYRLAIKPTTAGSVSAYDFSVAAAGHLDSAPGGQTWRYAQRTDAGAWTTTNTRRMFGGIRIAGVESAGGGGGQRLIGA